jgi:hypothetical protein
MHEILQSLTLSYLMNNSITVNYIISVDEKRVCEDSLTK